MTTLNELCEFIVDCEHKTAPIQEHGYPSIRTPNIGRGYFLLDGVNRVSDETYEAWTKRAIPQGGDLILAREAPVGNVAVIPEGEEFCLGQRTVLIRPNSALIDSRYLCFLLLTPQLRGELLAKSGGATVHHLNMKDIRSLEIPPLPPLLEQQKTASVISAYDDLIATNQRRITLLEDTARRLYREWFVQLRFPGHASVPVQDGVPQGWAHSSIGKCFDFYIGGGWGKEFTESVSSNAAYVIRGTDIPRFREGAISGVPLRFHTSSNLASRCLQSGDIVFESSGGSRDQGVGRLLQITAELLEQFDQPMICASFCKLIRPKFGMSEFLAYTLDYLHSTDGLRSFENQSASNIVNFAFTEFCEKQLIVVPTEEILASFQESVSTLQKQAVIIAKQQTQLARARDLLLPKLMSGQIDVSGIVLPEEVAA